MAVYLPLLIPVQRSAGAVTIVDKDKDKTTNVIGAEMTDGKIDVMIDVMGVEMVVVMDVMRMADGNVAIATESRAAEDLRGYGGRTTD